METVYLGKGTINRLKIPRKWQAILELLTSLQEKHTNAKGDGVADPETSAKHQELLNAAQMLVEGSHQTSFDTQLTALNELLITALLQSHHLTKVVNGPFGLFDSADSITLAHHRADADGGGATDHSALWLRLYDTFHITPHSQEKIEAQLNECLANATQKSQVIESFLACFELRLKTGPARQEAVLAAFKALFPESPLQVGEVELIASGTLLSFCIPFEGDKLLSKRFSDAGPEVQKEVSAFLRKIKKFHQNQFARFPAFGCFDPSRVDRAFTVQLSASSGVSEDTLTSLLNRMVSVLPLQEVDKYIVHDLWGHGWQGALVAFDKLYQQMAHFDEPIADTLSQDPQIIDSLFALKGNQIKLSRQSAEAWIHSYLANRLPVALTPIFAEMLADVIEFKFLVDHPALGSQMPSSSLYKFFPTKLDLILVDVPFYFSQATKPLRHLVSKKVHQDRLAQTLKELLASRLSLVPEQSSVQIDREVQELISVWQELEAKYYQTKITWTEIPGEDDHIETNSFSKILLNFVAIHRAIVHLEEDLHEGLALSGGEASPWSCAIKFRDLTALAAGLYFVQNPAEHLWSLDEYLSMVFKPQCLKLASLTETT